MEHAKSITKFDGADIGYRNNLHPANGEGRVGKQGIDATYSLDHVLSLMYNMEEKPNVLVKQGKGKWYIKKIDQDRIDNIDREVEKLKWRAEAVNRSQMWVIEWE
jgi:hypothetical protein